MIGFIYFIRCGEFVKIGFSKKPKVRLRALAIASPFELVTLATHAGSQEDERALHKWLAPHRHRGEWFRWHADVEQIIQHGLPHFDVAMPPNKRASKPLQELNIVGIARHRIGESQTAFAARFGVNQSTLDRWETRVPAHGAARKLIERVLNEMVAPIAEAAE